jgi:uncharacterized protein (TIGR03437 family)
MYKSVLKAALPIVALIAFSPSLPAQLSQVAVTNAATFQGQFPLSPGCWGTAFADFASVGITTPSVAEAVPFPATLGGVQVLVNEVAAPLSFVGGTQANFLVPRNTPEGRVPFKVTLSGMTIYEGAIQIFPVSPGLISINPADETKPGAVLNQDSTLNTETNPAAPGQVIQIFGVGADFAELPEDGAPAPADRLIATSTPAQAYVSVAEATVQFSGLAPNLVNAWQLNVIVPDMPFVNGQVTLQAELSGVKTNLVTIWVAR